eukprot:TRINITY_DN26381_c0_g1_i1.p1 TRINITY_DN26381_c0_g1~~TRINITY_DN26381_c0_g1_i1.p1  ORF type:complete len:130 (-),score=5.07 TRINITY_DN26381_c0_g1_i1:15-404(-)
MDEVSPLSNHPTYHKGHVNINYWKDKNPNGMTRVIQQVKFHPCLTPMVPFKWHLEGTLRCHLTRLLLCPYDLKLIQTDVLRALDCLETIFECIFESALTPFASFPKSNENIIFQTDKKAIRPFLGFLIS